MIRIRKLPSGVRIATDRMEGVRSCAIGIWLEVGSQHEQPGEYGLAHFLEHMFFKGTAKYDALALADELNRVGGSVNASTNQESICLSAHCVDEKAPRVLELLGEMLLDSAFDREELRRERNVVLEEHKMYLDTPDDLIVDQFYNNLWPGSPLGRPVLGTPRSIQRFSPAAIRRFLGREFRPSRVLIAIAGSFDPKKCSRVIDRTFRNPPPASGRMTRISKAPSTRARRTYEVRPVEQVHFCLGTEGPRRNSPDRYPFGMMNLILGGGMSSRLFREIREKRGLVYSIASFVQPYKKIGSVGVVGSTSPESLEEVMELTLAELRKIGEEGVTEDELEVAREQILDSLLMSVESTSSRMMRLADSMIVRGRPTSTKEIEDRVRQVRSADIRRVARKHLLGKSFAAALIGPDKSQLKALGPGVI